jgi:hypothetical protein
MDAGTMTNNWGIIGRKVTKIKSRLRTELKSPAFLIARLLRGISIYNETDQTTYIYWLYVRGYTIT